MLSDVKKRNHYDQFGSMEEEDLDFDQFFQEFDMDDLFDSTF